MKISQQARRDAKRLFRGCMAEGLLVEDRVRQVANQLVVRRPRNFLAILTQFKRLVQLDVARRTARVETIAPLEAGTQAAMEANLGRRYGSGLQYVYALNPALVGGARIQVGSDVFDGSVRARLRGLQETF